MSLDMTDVVLFDADFLNKIISEKEGRKLFDRIIAAWGKTPAVHEYVYYNELAMFDLYRDMVATGELKIIFYSDFLDDKLKMLYEKQFIDTYNNFHMDKVLLIPNGKTIFSHRQADSDFGELHTVLLALYSGATIICSNDSGTKDICTFFSYMDGPRFRVYNVFELIVELSADQRHLCITKDMAIRLSRDSANVASERGRKRIKERNKMREGLIKEIYKTDGTH